MSLSIFYTPIAKETLSLVYNFILQKFGSITAENFLKEAENRIDLIALNPFMYKATEIDKNIRKAHITRQSSLFYKVTGDEIHLLFFWDNRQEPFITE